MGRHDNEIAESVNKKDARPQILFVSLSLERGGTERHLAGIMPRLMKCGWNVSIYCVATRGEMAASVASQGVAVIRPPMEGSAWFKGPAKFVRLTLTGFNLFWLLLKRRPQIVHFFLPGPYLIGAPLSLLTLCPVRIMSRRNLNNYLAKRPFAAKLEFLLHGRMTAILGNSQRIVDELIGEEGCAPEDVGLIRNGIDIAQIQVAPDRAGVRGEFGVAASAFVAVIVANLNHYKGHADLVRGLELICDRMPSEWILLCAGRDDGCRKDLEQKVESAGLSKHVRFLGPRSDVPRLLKAADIGISASHEEGFSNAIIEGMAAGLPMVVTDVGGNTEAVRDGHDGIVVPAHNPDALGAAILSLALHPLKARAMGAAGAQRAFDEFSIASCVAKYDTLYRGLMSGKKAGVLAPHAWSEQTKLD